MAVRELHGGQLNYMSEEDMRLIHNAVLEVLNDVGIRMEYRPALEIMKENGLVIHEVPPAALRHWEDLVEKGFGMLIGDVISRDLYEKAKRIVSEYRQQ
jgi:trimethylamine:corrinoid methyltransferase-like protein